MFSKVKEKVKKFLKEALEVEGEVKVITIEKDGDGWIAETEVTERSQYLATIKPEYRVFEKHFYVVKLDSKLEVSSYKRKEEIEQEEEV